MKLLTDFIKHDENNPYWVESIEVRNQYVVKIKVFSEDIFADVLIWNNTEEKG